jgi:imidazolonepropionase-like amidohydrolase
MHLDSFKPCILRNMNFDLGGTVVAGTDTPAGVWNIPGMALHRELELFVEAGFSEMDALRSATCVAAKALYKNNLGSIKEGALADIVILNSNPIEDMRNTKAIDSVIKGGRVYSQADILESVPTEDYSKRILEEFLNEFEKQ